MLCPVPKMEIFMTCRLAIFDLDGTVLDTLPDLAAAINHALALHGLPARPNDTIRRFISNGVKKLVERSIYVPQKAMDAVAADTSDAFLKVIDDYTVKEPELFKAVHADFASYYLGHAAVFTVPYPGIKETLDQLKSAGIRLAMVTNKRDDVAHEIMERYFPGYFEIIIGDREGHPRKPAPDSVLEILERLGVGAEEAVYIGDSNVDIETAQNAGVDSIAVTWGYRDFSFLLNTGARAFVTQPQELAKLLQSRAFS